jgi:hypothetical protein
MSQPVLWIDHAYDREHAGTLSSRYATHIRRNAHEFADAVGDIAPVRFACAAWNLAVPPSLAPGYVRAHRRILSAYCVRNEWDGSLTAQLNLVSPLPAALTSSREWWQDRGWRDWPELFGQFVDPSAQDIAKSPHLRASLFLEAPMSLDGLPEAPETLGDDLEETAARAVAVLVRGLNDLVSPILRRLS